MINMTEPAELDVPVGSTDSSAGDACCGGGVSRLDADEAAELATDLGALADPVRLRMLSIIGSSDSGEVCACDFVGPIGKSQPTISHHLKVLSEAGLVAGEKRGRWVWYRVSPDRLDGLLGKLIAATGPVGDTEPAPSN